MMIQAEELGVLRSLEPSQGEAQEVKTMVNSQEYQAVKALRDKGWKTKAIARELGRDPKTIRKYVKLADYPGPRQTAKASKLAPFREHLERRMGEVNYQATVLHQELKEQGFTGGYEMVKCFVRPFRQEQSRLAEATMRFETGPAKQTQVDWFTTEVWFGKVKTRIQLFSQVLGFSRRLFAQAALDQTLPSLLRGHEAAFRHWGGLTETYLYDNAKTVVVHRDWAGQHIVWHPLFKDFADYWGFTPRLCKPYRAQTKGKIESGGKYVKGNFFPLRGREFHGLEHLNDELLRWTAEIADVRIHGTTHERPQDRFLRETLRPLPGQAAYQLETLITRKVPHDALVVYRTNRYSVPWTAVGRAVTLVEAGARVKIYEGATLLAEHPRRDGRFEQAVLAAHYDGLLARRRSEVPRLLLAPASPGEDVQVRDLDIYEAVASGSAA